MPINLQHRQKKCGTRPVDYRKKTSLLTVAKTVLFSLFLLGATGLQAQSFHYFRFRGAGADSTTYEALLTLYANGTSTARLKPVNSPPEKSGLVELELTDSLADPIPGRAVQQLVSVNQKVIAATGSNPFNSVMVFEFSEQLVNNLALYAPTALKTLHQGAWVALPLLENSSFSYAKADTALVKKFYQTTDPYYVSLFAGIKQPGLISRSLSNSQKNTRFYMVIVTDTLDEKVGKPCKRDMNNMTFVFNSISQKMGLQPPVITYVAGESFSRNGVISAIERVNPGPDDILVFYYSGHGFREAGDSSALPSMVLSNNYTLATLREQSLSMQSVADMVAKKASRLNLVFNDCCNVETPLPAATGKNPLISPKSIGLPVTIENFIRLFLEPRGTIIGSSSRPSEYSVGNPEKGGFFTWYLLLALETQLSRYNRNISWDSIFKEAAKNANYLALSGLCGEKPNQARCVQNPWSDFSRMVK